MKILVDTNILLRLASRQAPEHPDVVRAVTTLLARGDEPVIAAQVAIELWVVATRPVSVNGFGWSTAQTQQVVSGFRAQFPMLDDTPAIFANWLGLVAGQGIQGKRAHDARLAAVMLTHSVSTILTLNPRDFGGFPGVTVLTPRDL